MATDIDLLKQARDALEGILPYVEQDAEDIAKLGDQDEQDSVAAAIKQAQDVVALLRLAIP